MKNSNIVSHEKVYNEIKNEIINHDLKIGDWLLSENELCLKFNITRPTVRVALSKLESEGYIKRFQGKGSKVLSDKLGLGILSVSGTMNGINEQEKLKTSIISLSVSNLWDKNIPFDISKHTLNNIECICIKRKRMFRDLIVIYEETFMPKIFPNQFENIDLENKSLFNLLFEIYGIKIAGGKQRFKSKNASSDDVKNLDIDLGSSVLYIEREITTNNEDFKLYSILNCNTNNYFIEGSF